MLAIPENALARYNEVLYRKGISFVRADKLLNSVLKQRAVHETVHVYYRKWLRYFLDFCEKYPFPTSKSDQVRLFIEKLKSKNQPPQQCSQAAHAVSLYFESQKPIPSAPSADRKRKNHQSANLPDSPPKNLCTTNAPPIIDKPPVIPAATVTTPPPLLASPGGRRYNEWRCLEKTQSPGWDRVIDLLTAEIKVRHYSRKTLKTYADWSRKFQLFLTDKPPSELSSLDVKNYLTHLAVKQHVASSTQNQAFNALRFLFRHVLKKDFGDQRDIPRAKKSKYIPVVLSRPEIDAIISHLEYPFDIVVSLLYGCGLRLFECLGLRVSPALLRELLAHERSRKREDVALLYKNTRSGCRRNDLSRIARISARIR